MEKSFTTPPIKLYIVVVTSTMVAVLLVHGVERVEGNVLPMPPSATIMVPILVML